jgi:DNA-binding Lrp family transcriptional regulator
MVAQTDELDVRLLNALQEQVPLVERPFEAIGAQLGIDEAMTLRRIESLRTKSGGVIRQISAIFDSRALGYQSSLVAAKVPEARVDAAAEVISAHPGVSHNYRRSHPYNLWYTLALPPDSELGLQRTVDLLHAHSGALVTRLMPSLRVFKIGVKFDLSGDSDVTARTEPSARVNEPTPPPLLSERDKRLICVLQQDLPTASRPFDDWAKEAGCSVEDLLAAAKRYLDVGIMRRFSGVLRHRAAGFTANAMGAWEVPPDHREQFGQTAASFAAVSHCYERPTYEDWPYSIFTMVHAQSVAECERTIEEIAAATGVSHHISLYSTHEYKKVRVRYFTPEVVLWEQAMRQLKTRPAQLSV